MLNTTTLTPKEKRVIRWKPCALCLALPPFADGALCHVHRIVPAKKGGLYVRDNVVPLCPGCHRAHHRLAFIASCEKGGRIGGAKGGATTAARRTQWQRREAARHAAMSLSPEERSANARRAALALVEKHRERGLSQAERRQRGLTGLPNLGEREVERRRKHGLTDKELAHRRAMARPANEARRAKLTAEEDSEMRRRAWTTRKVRYGHTGNRPL